MEMTITGIVPEGVPEAFASEPVKRGRRLSFQERQHARIAEGAAHREREEAKHLANLDARGGRYGICYFLASDDGLVKIGFSRDLWGRVAAISPTVFGKVEVLAVAPGGRSRESYYHTKFREHRHSGEWFVRCPAIDAEIERLAATEFSLRIVHPYDDDPRLSRSQRQEQAA
jgi:hypothetical protein